MTVNPIFIYIGNGFLDFIYVIFRIKEGPLESFGESQ